MLFSAFPLISQGSLTARGEDSDVTILFTDSRKAYATSGAVFFAIRGQRSNGHDFIQELYDLGIRNFVVSDPRFSDLPEANVFLVPNPVRALQDLAAWHRHQFPIEVIGVTGSNGKTIVKEWLFQLLAEYRMVVKNPASYNSQIGVPLSVWQLNREHEIGIFEAGISLPGEMEALERVIQPTIGVLTNLGTAHDEGFESSMHKLEEKFRLFRNCHTLVYPADDSLIREVALRFPEKQHRTWGTAEHATLRYTWESPDLLKLTYAGETWPVRLSISDETGIRNVATCICTLLSLGFSMQQVMAQVPQLRAVTMRLEMKEGLNQCHLIDDTYNIDLGGLALSLQFMQRQRQHTRRTVILSDVLQTGLPDEVWVKEVNDLLIRSGVTRFIGVGPVFNSQQDKIAVAEKSFYQHTAECLANLNPESFQQELILIKGARSFRFEQLVQRLQLRLHRTSMEIDLEAMVRNLNYFKSVLQPGVKLMVMVKALAYGSGVREVGSLLQFHRVDYLGVAYPDEGVELRRNQITLPIMVMNPEADSFENLERYNLEPEIYSLQLFDKYINFLQGRPGVIHVKLDTGMHRLGFTDGELPELLMRLTENPQLRVASVFSHMAGADEDRHDAYSAQQFAAFTEMTTRISKVLGYQPIRHILNSPGILRFPAWQLDMVRLGIGLFGINPTSTELQLHPVTTLTTVVSQVKELRRGDTVGYGRWGKIEEPTKLATIAIGYADGYSRSFSRGKGWVLIHGVRCPVVGNVCMDMTMVDCSKVPTVKEGDLVEVFGLNLDITEVAGWISTIPYELLTQINERVRRIYVTGSV